jgi:putative transposase
LTKLEKIGFLATKEHYYTKFEEGYFYHVYNRSIDKQPLFRSNDNFRYFLKKYDEYLSPVADTYAYCLLGNHFHILLRVKEDLTTFGKLSNLPTRHPFAEKATHEIVSHQFRKFFQSYAMAFNKQHKRIGTLFQTPFKRALVNDDAYFTRLVYYIHANPQYHGLIDDFREWPWSSYARILIEKPSKLKKQEVINWFGDKNKFLSYHNEYHKMLADEKLIEELEDE